jgi:hypothetical protein
VLASLAVEIHLELPPEVGSLVALDRGRNVNGPEEGDIFGIVVVSLERAPIFLIVDACLFAEVTLPGEDKGLPAVGVDVASG